MSNNLSRYLNDLAHQITNLPVFHWFRLLGPGMAIAGLIIWFVTIHRSINVRRQLLGRMAGWLALIGFAFWVVGWLGGMFLAILLVLAAIVVVVFLLNDYLEHHP